MLGVPDATYYEASKKLRQDWAGTVQEALDRLPSRVFGRDAELDLSQALYSAADRKGAVEIPVMGRVTFTGAREVTGRVRIHGEQMLNVYGSLANYTAINMCDKNGDHQAWTFFSERYGTPALVKRNLIASHHP